MALLTDKRFVGLDTAEEQRIDSTAEKSEASSRWKDGSGTDETGHRSDPTHVCIGASAGNDAVQGSGSRYLLPNTLSTKMMFMTPGEIRRCSSEELTTMLEEAGEASKHARKRGRVMGIVAAHRLKRMREPLMYEELAIWRRENGFDRVAEGEESCFPGHRSLPPTPQEYYASLWCEVNALKEAISMPARTPCQKTAELFDGLKGKLPDWELAETKRYVEKRCREEVPAFNDWGGRGYDDSVPGVVIKTASSGDRTA